MPDKNIKMPDKNIKDYKFQQMSGKKFCALFPELSERLVKLTNKKECHYGFRFKTGLNKDNIKFNPTGKCEPGGIYFTDVNNIPRWLGYGDNGMKYCRFVTLKRNSKVYVEDNAFKADKFILSDRFKIKNLHFWSEKNYCLNAININVLSIKYIRSDICRNKIHTSKKAQLAAVKQNGLFIGYLLGHGIDVPKEVQLAAVENNSNSIEYLLKYRINIPEEVQLKAVKSHIAFEYLLDYKINVSKEVRLKAFRNHKFAVAEILTMRRIDISKDAEILEFIKMHMRSFSIIDDEVRPYYRMREPFDAYMNRMRSLPQDFIEYC